MGIDMEVNLYPLMYMGDSMRLFFVVDTSNSFSLAREMQKELVYENGICFFTIRLLGYNP
jgi:hypothetical protein